MSSALDVELHGPIIASCHGDRRFNLRQREMIQISERNNGGPHSVHTTWKEESDACLYEPVEFCNYF